MKMEKIPQKKGALLKGLLMLRKLIHKYKFGTFFVPDKGMNSRAGADLARNGTAGI